MRHSWASRRPLAYPYLQKFILVNIPPRHMSAHSIELTLWVGMNEDAFTFNLFALAAIVGDTGVAALVIVLVVVTGVVAPFTPAEDKTGAEVCFALSPLNGGMG